MGDGDSIRCGESNFIAHHGNGAERFNAVHPGFIVRHRGGGIIGCAWIIECQGMSHPGIWNVSSIDAALQPIDLAAKGVDHDAAVARIGGMALRHSLSAGAVFLGNRKAVCVHADETGDSHIQLPQTAHRFRL